MRPNHFGEVSIGGSSFVSILANLSLRINKMDIKKELNENISSRCAILVITARMVSWPNTADEIVGDHILRTKNQYLTEFTPIQPKQ